MWFKCRGCEARDQEIRHLLGELDRLHVLLDSTHKRVMELADPGINSRLTPRPTIARPVTPRAAPSATFPGYERPPKADEIEVA